jgi:hypothetical protein
MRILIIRVYLKSLKAIHHIFRYFNVNVIELSAEYR